MLNSRTGHNLSGMSAQEYIQLTTQTVSLRGCLSKDELWGAMGAAIQRMALLSNKLHCVSIDLPYIYKVYHNSIPLCAFYSSLTV